MIGSSWGRCPRYPILKRRHTLYLILYVLIILWVHCRYKELIIKNILYLHRAILYCTVLYCTVLYCTVLYCTVLYCTVLYCTVLYCTVLYCTETVFWTNFVLNLYFEETLVLVYPILLRNKDNIKPLFNITLSHGKLNTSRYVGILNDFLTVCQSD